MPGASNKRIGARQYIWALEFLLYSHKHMRGTNLELGKHEFSKDFLFIYVVFRLLASLS